MADGSPVVVDVFYQSTLPDLDADHWTWSSLAAINGSDQTLGSKAGSHGCRHVKVMELPDFTEMLGSPQHAAAGRLEDDQQSLLCR
ncbi:hypothetical protein ACLOJK_004973 [Asimina triloba]